MRAIRMAAAVAIALTLCLAVLPVHAQSIYGLSLRPTDAAPQGAPRGSVDIVAADGGYVVTVDLAGAVTALRLADYDDAGAFVVWAVNMDGVSENIGALDEGLMLEDTEVGYLIARLYVTAEADESVEAPVGERLYEVTLRNVTEVTTSAAAAQAADESPTVEPTEAAPAAPAPTAAADAKPKELPTTGSGLGDLLVLALVSMALIGAGLKLRTVRL